MKIIKIELSKEDQKVVCEMLINKFDKIGSQKTSFRFRKNIIVNAQLFPLSPVNVLEITFWDILTGDEIEVEKWDIEDRIKRYYNL